LSWFCCIFTVSNSEKLETLKPDPEFRNIKTTQRNETKNPTLNSGNKKIPPSRNTKTHRAASAALFYFSKAILIAH